MKKIVFLICTLASISGFTSEKVSVADIHNFTGEFNGSCSTQWKSGQIENFEGASTSVYDELSNFLIIKLSNDKQLVVFDRINEPRLEESGRTDTHLCRKRIKETILSNKILKMSSATKSCFFNRTIEYTEATATLVENQIFNVSVNNEMSSTTCRLIKK